MPTTSTPLAHNGRPRKQHHHRSQILQSPLLILVALLIGLFATNNCHASSIVVVPRAKNTAARRHCHDFLTPLRGGAISPTESTSSSSSSSSTLLKNLPTLPKWSHKILAGGTSRALAQALLYPIDALRTLAQTRDSRTLADVGTNALLRGCAQTSSFALFTGALQFGIYGIVRDQWGCGPLVASAMGAAGSCLVSVPQEVIKQRLVTGVYGSFREAVGSIWRMEGVCGFYSAWKPTVSRNVPFVVTTFTSRDVLRRRVLEYREKKLNQQNQQRRGRGNGGEVTSTKVGLGPVENLAIGITSALVAGLMTQPIDVIKTRMMTQASSNAVPYKSAVDCALTVLRTEGWRKLYSGFGQRSLYMCGLWGITFSMEPLLSSYLEKKNNK